MKQKSSTKALQLPLVNVSIVGKLLPAIQMRRRGERVTDDYLETMFIERFYDQHPEATEDDIVVRIVSITFKAHSNLHTALSHGKTCIMIKYHVQKERQIQTARRRIYYE
jgi:hypothetical protein